jgi:hypothetical protein
MKPLVLLALLLFDNVTIVDPVTERLTAGARVVIRDGRIESAGPRAEIRIPPGARRIDAAGQFLIPGLWDMHVHVGKIEPEWFPLYLANGITGVREMAAGSGAVAPQRQYQQDVGAGRRLGPRLFWTAEPIDRRSIDKSAPFGVRTPEEARQAVRHVKSLGTTYVKVYDALSREAYFAILEEAALLGMAVTGHVPDAVSPFEAAARGQRSIEHLHGLLLACSAREAELRTRFVATRQYPQREMLESFSLSKLDELAAAFVKHQTWVTPTLSLTRWADPRAASDPRLRYVRPDYLKWWRESLRDRPGPWQNKVSFGRFRQIVRALHAHGAPILAGTDTPNPYCLPGFGLHDELQLLVEAGLTPAAALRAATTAPARFLGLGDSGSIAPGQRADLVLLRANPLVDIRNTTQIAGVVAAGRWFDRAEIDRMLAGVESAVRPK